MYKCHLVIEGSLTEIQEIMALLSPVKEHVTHVGNDPLLPVPSAGSEEITQLDLPIEPMDRVVTPTQARIHYEHCKTCGLQYVPAKGLTRGFCSKSCYNKNWYDRHKSRQVVPPPPAPPEDRTYGPGGVRTKEPRMNDERRETAGKFKKEPAKRLPSDNFGGMF